MAHLNRLLGGGQIHEYDFALIIRTASWTELSFSLFQIKCLQMMMNVVNK